MNFTISKAHHTKKQVAFTLIEIMIALAIFSMITVGIYTSWNAIINASRIGLNAAAEAQRKRNAIEAIQSALFGTQMYTANLRHHYFLADTAIPEASLLSFVSLLPESFPGSGFYPNDPMRRVTFTLDTDGDGNQNLVMYQTPVLASVEEMSEPIPIRLAKNVSLFSVEFYDNEVGEWLVEWESTNSLPRQVRFALEFENRDKENNVSGDPDLETRVVTIPSSAIPIQIQRPGALGGASGIRRDADGSVIPGDNRGGRGSRFDNNRGGGRPSQDTPSARGRGDRIRNVNGGR